MRIIQYVTLTHRKQSSLGCHHFLSNHSKKSHGAVKNLMNQPFLFRFGFSDKITDGAFTPKLLVSISGALTPTLFISLGRGNVLPWHEFEILKCPLVDAISFSTRWDLRPSRGRGCFHIEWILGGPGSETVLRKSIVYSVGEKQIPEDLRTENNLNSSIKFT